MGAPLSPVLRSGMLPCGAGRERAGVFSPGDCGDWSDDLHAEIAMTPVRPTVANTPTKLLERRIASSFCSRRKRREIHASSEASSTAQRSAVDRKNTVTLLAQQFPALLVAHESGRPLGKKRATYWPTTSSESERPLRTLRRQSRPSMRFCRHAGFLARPRRRATTDSLPASADHPNLVVNQVD